MKTTDFKGIQKIFRYIQIQNDIPERVFPLLCPVREHDWLEGWSAKIIHSHSGLAEKNCVFSTPHHGKAETIWIITQYDPVNFIIEFVRHTPNNNVVRINIKVDATADSRSMLNIEYRYTALSENQNKFIETELEAQFIETMQWWEKSANYYLETGKILRK